MYIVWFIGINYAKSSSCLLRILSSNIYRDSSQWFLKHLLLTILFKKWRGSYGPFLLKCFSGSNQDNCSNNSSLWKADPSMERCPQQDFSVQVIAGIYMMFTNLLLVNIVIAKFRLKKLNWFKIIFFATFFFNPTVVYSERLQRPMTGSLVD